MVGDSSDRGHGYTKIVLSPQPPSPTGVLGNNGMFGTFVNLKEMFHCFIVHKKYMSFLMYHSTF